MFMMVVGFFAACTVVGWLALRAVTRGRYADGWEDSLLTGLVIAVLTAFILLQAGLFSLQSLVITGLTALVIGPFWIRRLSVSTFYSGRRPTRFPCQNHWGIVMSALIGILALAWWWEFLYEPRNISTVCWYYFQQALQIAQQETIPVLVEEYGTNLPFETDKLGLSILGATILKLLGPTVSPTVSIWVLTWSVLWVLLVGLSFFLRQLYWRLPLAAIITLGALLLHPLIITTISGFRGETLGAGFGFCLLGVLIRGPDRQQLRFACQIALLTIGIVLAHPDSPVFFGLMATGWCLSRLITKHKGEFSVLIAGAGAVTGLLLVIAVWASTHSSPLELHASIIQAEPALKVAGPDDTVLLRKLFSGFPDDATPRNSGAIVGIESHLKLIADQFMARLRSYWRTAPALQWLFIGLIVFMFTGALPFAKAALPLRASLRGASWGLLLVVGFVVLFTLSNDLHVLKLHASKRVLPYIFLFPFVFIGGLVVIMAAMTRRIFQVRLLANFVTVAVMVFFLAQSHKVAVRFYYMWKGSNSYVSRSGEEAIQFIKAHTQPDATFLLDGMSEGAFAVLTERRAVLEGRAPYLQPANRSLAIEAIRLSRRFFAGKDAGHVLDLWDVDYVITGADELSLRHFKYNDGKLNRKRLSLLKQFGELAIYQVTQSQTQALVR